MTLDSHPQERCRRLTVFAEAFVSPPKVMTSVQCTATCKQLPPTSPWGIKRIRLHTKHPLNTHLELTVTAERFKMLLLGLTGSIATGKSTVSNLLRSPPYNLPIIDADVLARQVVEPGTPGYTAIVKIFGPTTPDLLLPASDALSGGREDGPHGKGRPLNRPALGRRVFGEGADKLAERKKLNGIVHPQVRKALWRALAYYYITGHWAVVLDIPLLFESGWEALCGAVVVVAVSDPKIQMDRLRARDSHLTAEDAQNRVQSQGDVRDKARRAEARGKGWGAVVWNDGDREELSKELQKVMTELGAGTPGWWAKICWLCPPVGLMSAGWCYWKSRGMQKSWEKEVQRERAKL